MIDIINAHVQYYDELILLTGFLNPRETPLHPKVKVKMLTPYKRSSGIKRLLTWMGFWLQSLFYIFLRYRHYHLYFVSNPPLNIFSAKFTKRKFAFLIYDIYPEALVKNNIIKESSIVFRYWQNVNHKVYPKAEQIFTLSHGMKNLMNLDEDQKDKVKVVPVWTNNTFFEDVEESENIFIKKHELQEKFIISYSGNLGKTHPVEKIIDLAKALTHVKDVMFLIIGEGEKKNMLLEQHKKLKLKNLKILDFQPTELFPQVLAAANIGVVTLESKAADLSVPSKTYNLMSAGKPILTIADTSSELARITEQYKIGKNFEENQITEMIKFILKLKNNSDLYLLYQNNSKQTSLKFSPENAKKMILN